MAGFLVKTMNNTRISVPIERAGSARSPIRGSGGNTNDTRLFRRMLQRDALGQSPTPMGIPAASKALPRHAITHPKCDTLPFFASEYNVPFMMGRPQRKQIFVAHSLQRKSAEGSEIFSRNSPICFLHTAHTRAVLFFGVFAVRFFIVIFLSVSIICDAGVARFVTRSVAQGVPWRVY